MKAETLGKLRIALTRESDANKPLAAMLREHGAVVYDCPLIAVASETTDEFDSALGALGEYNWLVLTSAHAAQAVISRVKVPPTVLVACVGDATANVVRGSGKHVSLVPRDASAAGLLKALKIVEVKGNRILWPRSEIADSALKSGLEALGARVDDPVAYGNAPNAEGGALLAHLLYEHALDAVVFASASASTNAVGAAGELLAGVRLYSIGPATSRPLLDSGLEIAGEAADHSVAGLFATILAGESNRE